MTNHGQPLVSRIVLAAVGLAAPAALAQVAAPAASTTPAPAAVAAPNLDGRVPTTMDTVQRGVRMRVDLGGRAVGVGLPDPAVRLEVDELVQDRNDIDVSGVVLFGWDRPANLPVMADLAADFGGDLGGDSPASPFLDDQSQFPRARLYSAFIGLSPTPAEGLAPFRLNVGRMTELVESPITYDGASAGMDFKLRGLGRVGAKLWGGFDAPQRLYADTFSRTNAARLYTEAYAPPDDFVTNTGAIEVVRTPVTDAQFNAVGGLRVDGELAGVGFVLSHTLMPAQSLLVDDADNAKDVLFALERTTLGASYRVANEFFTLTTGGDVKATDFVPRSVGLRADAMTEDGTTRAGVNMRVQFLEDLTAYDGTFRAFAPSQQENGGVFDPTTNAAIEQLRSRDQIRHLNFGPPQEHVVAMADVERQLPLGLSASLRGRVRQHFDAADLDMFRTNILEGGVGLGWSPGMALDVGSELVGGTVDSGKQDGLAYDLNAEGVQSYVESRTWTRATLLDGKLSTLTEVFVRRTDVQTRQVLASGQWSAALSTTARYDVSDFWSLAARLDGDVLSPIDALNASSYLGGLLTSSLRF